MCAVFATGSSGLWRRRRLSRLTFILGGATGLLNASFTMNQEIHNTWVSGHFHMTVGTAVALTVMPLPAG